MTNKEMMAMLISQLKLPMEPFMRMEKLNLLKELAQKDKNEQMIKEACSALIYVINNHLKDLEHSKQLKAHDMLKSAHTVYGRYNFESYLISMEWNRPLEKRFYQPRMRVLKPVIQDLQDLGDGKINVYILSMPPRIGKSTIGLFFISWIAGRYPNEHIFGAGYASGLVGTFYNAVLDFIDSEEYRFYEIFPELKGRMNKSAENRTIDLWKDERYKTVTFRSIDGQITGALEAESLLYLDDLCSGIEEAMNKDRLDKLWSKVTVDLLQRRIQNKRTKTSAPILAIGTIWSIHDPISRLKNLFDEQKVPYRQRVMPALDDKGQSNFDYDFGMGFTTEMYLNQKAAMDEVSWECVFQQHPIERDGLLFPRGELKRYLALPPTQPDAIIAWCDVAFGGNDFLCFPICYFWGDDGYVVDVVFRKKADYKVTEPMVAGKIIQHKVQQATFEANNGGDFYARDVDDLVKQQSDHRCNILTQRANSKLSKLARIIQYAPDIKNLYYRDESLFSAYDEYGAFINNVTTFLQTGASENDDGPDGLAGLCSMKKIPRYATIVSRPGIRSMF